MSRERQDRILATLARASGWVTAGELADSLGVTTRSVRSYVTAIKARPFASDIIESGPSGYRLDRERYAVYRREASMGGESEGPRDRMHALIRSLIDQPSGIDLHATAERMFVSESTLESDLARVRTLLADSGLQLVRGGSTLRLSGNELDRRRVLSRLFRAEATRGTIGVDDIAREFGSADLGAVKTDLISVLTERDYYINDFGLDNVLLHLAIAVDRVSRHGSVALTHTAGPEWPEDGEISAVLSDLVKRHFSVDLGDDDLGYLGFLLTTRAVAPGDEPGTPAPGRAAELVRRIAKQAGEAYLIDLDDEDFIARLSLHVSNLLRRVQDRSFAHNPLTRSIKTSYPMIYELAVFIARELGQESGAELNDDEIAYIAMHVGAHLQQQVRREELISVAIVCPNYYDLHLRIREEVTRALGDVIDIVRVVTRSDVDWDELGEELVLTTIEPPVPADRLIRIQPFFGEADADRVRQAVSRVRRQRRRAGIKDELLRYFDERLFLRNHAAHDENAMIMDLGARMVDLGVIGDDYVDGAIARERMSSTAFTDALAVPHAMEMSAATTSIAIAVNEQSMPWGDGRVNVVALIAFSAAERQAFQTVFDQFVEVFSERDDVQRIVRESVDFSSFIDALVHIMDA